MNRSVTLFVVLVCGSAIAVAEKPGEPILLFNGTNFDGWVMTDGSPVNKGWEVANGEIHLKPFDGTRAGSIRTTETFGSFELEFEWRVAAGGNSGVKYLAREADSRFGRNFYGCEYQLLDDKGHKNGRKPITSAGALYGLYPPDAAAKELRPVGEFNRSRIIVDGPRVEHWLNGKKIVEAVIGSDDWEARVRKSKVADIADFARQPGSILLQEHLSEAWFRNLRLTLKPPRADEPAAAAPESRFANQTGPNRRVLAADYSAGKKRLALVDAQGTIHWETKINNIHDVHLLDNGNILTQTDWTRVVEFDPDGNVAWEYDAATANGNAGKKIEVHAVQRLANGDTMIAESGSGRIIEVDRDGTLKKEIKLAIDTPNPHRDTRNARKLDTGHYLVAHEGDLAVREYDGDGKVVWDYDAGTKVYSAIRLKNGNTLIGTGSGHSVIEVTPDQRIVWAVTENDLPGCKLAWVTQVARLENGNTIIVNCHAGPDNPQIVEVTPEKKIVWSFKDFDMFGNAMPAAQVLDIEGDIVR